MELFITTILGLTALYGIAFSSFMTTRNGISFLIFRAIPFSLGIASFVGFLFRLGFIIAI